NLHIPKPTLRPILTQVLQSVQGESFAISPIHLLEILQDYQTYIAPPSLLPESIYLAACNPTLMLLTSSLVTINSPLGSPQVQGRIIGKVGNVLNFSPTLIMGIDENDPLNRTFFNMSAKLNLLGSSTRKHFVLVCFPPPQPSGSSPAPLGSRIVIRESLKPIPKVIHMVNNNSRTFFNPLDILPMAVISISLEGMAIEPFDTCLVELQGFYKDTDVMFMAPCIEFDLLHKHNQYIEVVENLIVELKFKGIECVVVFFTTHSTPDGMLHFSPGGVNGASTNTCDVLAGIFTEDLREVFGTMDTTLFILACGGAFMLKESFDAIAFPAHDFQPNNAPSCVKVWNVYFWAYVLTLPLLGPIAISYCGSIIPLILSLAKIHKRFKFKRRSGVKKSRHHLASVLQKLCAVTAGSFDSVKSFIIGDSISSLYVARVEYSHLREDPRGELYHETCHAHVWIGQLHYMVLIVRLQRDQFLQMYSVLNLKVK
ncbi:hypothetical protein F5051DRAFT_490565, partial [Lentinula edodes]